MTGGIDRNEAALWRRWRATAAGQDKSEAEPDAMTLAAYAENRLGRAGTDPEFDAEIAAVDAWLATHPEAVADLRAARDAATGALDGIAEAEIVARAQTLVAPPSANVVPLRAGGRSWRHAMAWSGIAASLVAASLVGFSVGASDWLNLTGASQSQSLEQVLMGPTTILGSRDLGSGT